MQIETYPDRDMLALMVADTLAGELKQCLLRHETASFVVPGGTSPGLIFDALCAADLEWGRVHVLLSDERWVPEDSPRSNGALVRSRLMVDRASDAVFVPFYRDGHTPASAAQALSAELDPELPISLMLLGMGTDMHTASLFPRARGLADALAPNAPSLVPVEADGQEPRISLSGPVIAGAMSKHLVIYGQDKLDAIERARGMDPEAAPIRIAMDGLTVHWAE